MVSALILLVITSAETYVEQNHGVFYNNIEETINEYHLDDVTTIAKAYQDKQITFKWDF